MTFWQRCLATALHDHPNLSHSHYLYVVTYVQNIAWWRNAFCKVQATIAPCWGGPYKGCDPHESYHEQWMTKLWRFFLISCSQANWSSVYLMRWRICLNSGHCKQDSIATTLHQYKMYAGWKSRWKQARSSGLYPFPGHSVSCLFCPTAIALCPIPVDRILFILRFTTFSRY